MEKERMEEFRSHIKHHLSNGNQVGAFVADTISGELHIDVRPFIDAGIDELINLVQEEIAASVIERLPKSPNTQSKPCEHIRWREVIDGAECQDCGAVFQPKS